MSGKLYSCYFFTQSMGGEHEEYLRTLILKRLELSYK